MICLSFDLDWVNDEILKYTMDILDERSIPATLFCTNTSPYIESLKETHHELGIHPNLVPVLMGEKIGFQNVILELLSQFPAAKGARFHSLITGTPIINFCQQHGIVYDSSIYSPVKTGAFSDALGIVRVPFHLSDLQVIYDQKEFDLSILPKGDDAPLVICFHPIHVFLNTEKRQRYEEAKSFYHQTDALRSFRNETNVKGTCDFLKEIVNAFPVSEFKKITDIIEAN